MGHIRLRPEPRVAVLIGNDDDISFWYPLLIAASRAARAAADPLLTREEAAAYAHVDPETIRLWCKQGLGYFDANARRWLIPQSELDARLQQRHDRLKKLRK